jgi:ParB-like nuclease family protein
MLFHSSTGVPVIDAQEDFLRARRAQVAARAARWVAGGRRCARVPRTLTDTAGVPRGAARLEVIPLKTIVGTLEPTIMFDAAFRPASELVRACWERIALAHRRGVSLPPIRVLRGEDGYYVVDGRHRVSVALALGWRDIDAWVTPVRTVSATKSAEAA